MRRHGKKRDGTGLDGISIKKQDGTENNDTEWDRTGSGTVGGWTVCDGMRQDGKG